MATSTIKKNKPIQVSLVNCGNYTVNPNTAIQVNIWQACINACPNGYSFVGLVGFTTNNVQALVASCRPINEQWAFECRNVSGSAQNVSVDVWALYVQN